MFPQHLLSRQFWTDDLKKGLEDKEFSTRMQHLTALSLELGTNTSLQLLKQQVMLGSNRLFAIHVLCMHMYLTPLIITIAGFK